MTLKIIACQYASGGQRPGGDGKGPGQPRRSSRSSHRAYTCEDYGIVGAVQFAEVGGVSATNVAVWNGAAWSALGSGVDDDVNALAVDTRGLPVASGSYLARLSAGHAVQVRRLTLVR